MISTNKLNLAGLKILGRRHSYCVSRGCRGKITGLTFLPNRLGPPAVMTMLRTSIFALIVCCLIGAGVAVGDDARNSRPAVGRVSFELDVLPILTATGRTQGACPG